MSYDSVKCIPKWDSIHLNGALSTRQDFLYGCAVKDEIDQKKFILQNLLLLLFLVILM